MTVNTFRQYVVNRLYFIIIIYSVHHFEIRSYSFRLKSYRLILSEVKMYAEKMRPKSMSYTKIQRSWLSSMSALTYIFNQMTVWPISVNPIASARSTKCFYITIFIILPVTTTLTFFTGTTIAKIIVLCLIMWDDRSYPSHNKKYLEKNSIFPSAYLSLNHAFGQKNSSYDLIG